MPFLPYRYFLRSIMGSTYIPTYYFPLVGLAPFPFLFFVFIHNCTYLSVEVFRNRDDHGVEPTSTAGSRKYYMEYVQDSTRVILLMCKPAHSDGVRTRINFLISGSRGAVEGAKPSGIVLM